MTLTRAIPPRGGDAAVAAAARWRRDDPLWDPTGEAYTAALASCWKAAKALTQDFADLAGALASGDDAAARTFAACDAAWCDLRDRIQELYVFGEAASLDAPSGPENARARTRVRRVASAHQASPQPVVRALARRDDAAADLGALPDTAAARWQGWIVKARERAQTPALNALAPYGPAQWQKLYQDIRAELQFAFDGPDGPGRASARAASRLLLDPDRELRRSVFEGVETAWAPHRQTVAAALSACTGWRGARAMLSETDVYSEALEDTSLSRAAMERCYATAERLLPVTRKAARLQAQLAGLARLQPWDLDASEARVSRVPLPTAVREVSEAFAGVSSGMGAFFDHALDRGWIDTRPFSEGRMTTDFQTSIARRGIPLVRVNYDGHALNAIRVAHECAHAFHFWTIRDLPAECHYLPSASAETVAAFGELALRNRWQSDPSDRAARWRYAWMEAQAILCFLVMLPANAAFERRLTEKPEQRDADTLDALFEETWLSWFGADDVAPDTRAWYRKPVFIGAQLHGLPYVAGFLLAHGLEQRRQSQDGFGQLLHELLRAMAVQPIGPAFETVLGRSLEDADIWHDCAQAVEARVRGLERAVAGPGGLCDD